MILRDGRIDIAVHSLKDLPVDDEPGLTLGAITSRAPVGDGLVAREGWTLFYLLDEILQGTNSAERHIAVERVLAHLITQGAIGLLTKPYGRRELLERVKEALGA